MRANAVETRKAIQNLDTFMSGFTQSEARDKTGIQESAIRFACQAMLDDGAVSAQKYVNPDRQTEWCWLYFGRVRHWITRPWQAPDNGERLGMHRGEL